MDQASLYPLPPTKDPVPARACTLPAPDPLAGNAKQSFHLRDVPANQPDTASIGKWPFHEANAAIRLASHDDRLMVALLASRGKHLSWVGVLGHCRSGFRRGGDLRQL